MIIGKLIPAGTGMNIYRDIEIEPGMQKQNAVKELYLEEL